MGSVLSLWAQCCVPMGSVMRLYGLSAVPMGPVMGLYGLSAVPMGSVLSLWVSVLSHSHHSGEVPVGSFCRVSGSVPPPWPCALSALEEHNFLFQLQAPERPPQDIKEGLEVPLVAVIQWSTPKLPFTSSIYTHYRSVRAAPHAAPAPQPVSQYPP
uniref:TRAPP14 N-terminal domain-containing protein n=1 Tax=Coturnix japonica TaxID=93934 RepID=A0A8C2SPZ6_COTJA